MAVSTLDTAEHFDAAEFDELIAQNGTPAIWRRARTCPCLHPVSRQADINCAYCRDYPGLLWGPGIDITILLPGRQRSDRDGQAGSWMEGFSTVTFPSTANPGHLDRIELTAAEMVVNGEQLIRGDVDPQGRSLERLRLAPIEVEFCDAIVAGLLQPFTPGVDFSVGDDRVVSWAAPSPLPDGTLYTLRYRARATYVLWSPMSRDEGGAKQPYRVQAQRLDFFRMPAAGVD